MNLATLYRIVSFAWQGFWRNIWLSLATITIIVLAVISINFLIIISIVTDTALEVVKEKVDISLYFKPGVTEPQVLEVQTFLSSLTQVRDIEYISEGQALEDFKQRHRQDTAIIESLEGLSANPIGATLRVKTKTIDDYGGVIEAINNNSKYNELIADRDFSDHDIYIARIKNFSDNIKAIGLFTVVTFILIAALIVFNTIRVTIYTHREEIGIMKLVGATNWFIRSPFILEGVLYGVIACAVGIAIVYPIIGFIQPYVNSFFLTESFSIVRFFNEHFGQIFGLEVLIIVFLNIISSSVAIRRYLKV